MRMCDWFWWKICERRNFPWKWCQKNFINDPLKWKREIMPIFFNESREKKIGDENCRFQSDSEIKHKSMGWKSPGPPRPKRALISESKVKKMFIYFSDCKGIVHREFVSCDQTVIEMFCLQILEGLRRLICRVRPELLAGNWILQHDNAPSCITFSSRRFWRRTWSWSWNSSLSHQISLHVTPCSISPVSQVRLYSWLYNIKS
jgi:hypothetical protein